MRHEPPPPEFEPLLEICRIRGWATIPQGEKFGHLVTQICARHPLNPQTTVAVWYIAHNKRGVQDLLHLIAQNT